VAGRQRIAGAILCRITHTKAGHHPVTRHMEDLARVQRRCAGEYAKELIQQRHDARRRQTLGETGITP
jgi:hypothetical protein